MSAKIKDFINKMNNWRLNFVIQDYNYSEYNCEIANLMKWQNDNDENKIIDFWNKQLKNKYFQIRHPLYNHIILRAVFSCFNNFLHNAIFFIDKNNTHPLIWIQFSHAVNCILVENYFLRIKEPWGDNATLSSVDLLKNDIVKIQLKDLIYQDKIWGFTATASRPLHYFFDCFPVLYKLNLDKIYEKGFFIPKKFKKMNKTNEVLFYPSTISISKPDLFLKACENIKNEVLLQYKNNDSDYNLILFVNLPVEKRYWLQQFEGIANILKHLNKHFKKIKVYIDGMTAYDGERQDFPENKILFNKVVNVTKELFLKEYNKEIVFIFEELQVLNNDFFAKEERLIVFKSLAGYDYRTKICYCNDCDISINPLGTGKIIPVFFVKKPFVGFENPRALNIHHNLIPKTIPFRIVSKEFDMAEENIKSIHFQNYHIPPEHIYNLAAEILEELSAAGKLKVKNLKMHRLDVPPVELIAKKYELEQKLNIKVSIENVALFSELEKKIDILALNNTTIINNANNTTLSIQNKEQCIHNLEQSIQMLNHQILFKTAKARIQNHLSYKLGQALIENSKSILGYIRMPYVLSYIKDKHKFEQKAYEEKIKENPNLALPPLECYPDYQEALKEKECFTYKLGQALMEADKEWYKGGYVKFYFKDVPRLKREFGKK
ncbi:hypothetical protein ACMZVA_000606 [Campylobacter jejuni]